jgi:hypothetical protein
LYLESTGDYIYNSGNFRLGAGKITFNGTLLNIASQVNITNSSTISGDLGVIAEGATFYAGASKSTGNRVVMNSGGLFGYNGTTINFSFPNSTGLFSLGAGDISGWSVSSGNIEKSTTVGATTTYSGISAGAGTSNSALAFYAGGGSAGSGSPKFKVTHGGVMTATGVVIKDGQLDIGADWPTGGFHVDTSGLLKATGADIRGYIEATSGKITGNFQVESGTFWTGTSPTNKSVLINSKGLASIDASNNTLTAILNTPISSGLIPLGSGLTDVGTLPNAISFFTQAALIGGWVVNSTQIKDRSSQFVLDSTAKTLSITGVIDVSTNFKVEIGTGANVFSAGVVGQTAATSISRSGVLTANNADIRGTLTTSSGNMKFGDNVSGSSSGIFIDSNDYWFSTGTFSFANGRITYVPASSGVTETLNINASTIKMNIRSNNDGTAGDSTIVQAANGELTLGRAFFYAGLNYPNGALDRGDIPSFPGKEQGDQAFNVGDIILSRLA